MNDQNQCKYVVYRLGALPAGLFGETYAISAAIAELANTYRCECYVVSQRSEPHLFSESFSISPGDTPEEFLKVDIDFVLQEGKQQAEMHLADRLLDIAEKKQRPNLYGLNIELVELSYTPLLGCWMRGVFHEEIRSIAKATECNQLRFYLDAVTRSSFVIRPG